jgi:hypothetical protein
MINMLIHSAELGKTPALKSVQNSFRVEKDHPISHIWDWTASCSDKHKGIKNLLIACHGLYSKLEGTNKTAGGFGIELGTGIHKFNIDLIKKLQGKVSNIYLYVCGAAIAMDQTNLDKLKDTNQSFHPDYVTDNRVLCSQMAGFTEANVYASSEMQDYNDYWGFLAFDFKTWEGKVEKFTPQGAIVDVTSRMNPFGKEIGNE